MESLGGFNVDDPAQPPATRNPAEPYAAGNKVAGTIPDGTTQPRMDDGGMSGEHKFSRTRAEMAPPSPEGEGTDMDDTGSGETANINWVELPQPCLMQQLQDNCKLCCSSGCVWAEGAPGWDPICTNSARNLEGPFEWGRVVLPEDCSPCTPSPPSVPMDAAKAIAFGSLSIFAILFLCFLGFFFKRRQRRRRNPFPSLEEAIPLRHMHVD